MSASSLAQEEPLLFTQPGWAVAYLAPAPSAGWGIAAGRLDREAAHRRAEALCIARSGGVACRLVAELRAQCLAVAQAPLLGDDQGRVAFGTVAGAAERVDAETQAIATCQMRLPGRLCRIVESSCAGG
ncbi:DUF4189 domain-containing protein [Humitalea rosea]|uniref:DUF4189 domain-containing protein n=1 Tax=Humitalea rosea TaxID=990373 RepID=UPI0013149D56|nr:DUF4189 domain-containing protein [Humitalea rosea]